MTLSLDDAAANLQLLGQCETNASRSTAETCAGMAEHLANDLQIHGKDEQATGARLVARAIREAIRE